MEGIPLFISTELLLDKQYARTLKTIKRADEAVYKAKGLGRNKVVIV